MKHAPYVYKLAALATAALPDLRVVGVNAPQLDDEVAQMTGLTDTSGDRWIVFAPKESKTTAELEAYGAVLTWLEQAVADHAVSFRTPVPRVFISRSENHYAMVYRDLGGGPLDEGDLDQDLLLAGSLGRALAALHDLAGRAGAAELVPTATADDSRQSVQLLLENVQKRAATSVSKRLLRRWGDAVNEDSLWFFTPGFLHGDLTAGAVQVKRSIVTAFTGFTAARIDDPALDLAWLLPIASDQFVDRLIEHYSRQRDSVDLHLLTRAQLYSELAVLKWLLHGKNIGDEQIVSEATAMLVDLDDQLSGAGLVRSQREVHQIDFTPDEEPLMQLRKSQQGAQPTKPEAVGAVEVDSAALTVALEADGAAGSEVNSASDAGAIAPEAGAGSDADLAEAVTRGLTETEIDQAVASYAAETDLYGYGWDDGPASEARTIALNEVGADVWDIGEVADDQAAGPTEQAGSGQDAGEQSSAEKS